MSAAEIQLLHERAMMLADAAFESRRKGDREMCDALFREAFECEMRAARRAYELQSPEPSLSILCRSAATLALDCSQPEDAEKMVSLALSGSPPSGIADELRDIYETVNFRRHLKLKGVSLEHNEFQVSLAGNSVGYGVALSREVLDRLDQVGRLVRRTVERKLGTPFRDSGRPSKEVSGDYSMFLSVPRAASFAVSIKLAQPSGQKSLPGVLDDGAVVDEVLRCIELFDANRQLELRETIRDDAYYRNFIAIAKAIAPDGSDINLVGFTGARRTVAMRTRRRDIAVLDDQTPTAKPPAKIVEEVGTLLFADSRLQKRGQIRLRTRGHTEITVHVPEGMMADIVKPLWESTVIIKAENRDGAYHLLDIAKAK